MHYIHYMHYIYLYALYLLLNYITRRKLFNQLINIEHSILSYNNYIIRLLLIKLIKKCMLTSKMYMKI